MSTMLSLQMPKYNDTDGDGEADFIDPNSLLAQML